MVQTRNQGLRKCEVRMRNYSHRIDRLLENLDALEFMAPLSRSIRRRLLRLGRRCDRMSDSLRDFVLDNTFRADVRQEMEDLIELKLDPLRDYI